jgi:glycerol-3-phosphate dehydrogenase (NAD(P)+)
MRVAVIGAGSWGTAVSWLLGSKGIDVTLWSRECEIAESINAGRHNPLYLKDVELPATVTATCEYEAAVLDAAAVVMVTPSYGVRETAEHLAPFLGDDVPVINLSKGIEKGSLLRMTEVLEDVLGNRTRLAALSGPNHAEEVGKGIPSATVVAAYDEAVGRRFRDLFQAPAFRVYTNPDVVGVELCGVSKNVIAVAAGLSDGSGYGDNSKASLMTRGLAEMARLGTRLGAEPLTYMGLAGVGDLIATCTSKHSRNRALGEMVARGGTIASFTETTHMVAEGATSAITLDELGAKVGIELPITHLVRAILYDGLAPEAAGRALLGRDATDELHGLDLIED